MFAEFTCFVGMESKWNQGSEGEVLLFVVTSWTMHAFAQTEDCKWNFWKWQYENLLPSISSPLTSAFRFFERLIGFNSRRVIWFEDLVMFESVANIAEHCGFFSDGMFSFLGIFYWCYSIAFFHSEQSLTAVSLRYPHAFLKSHCFV